MHMVQPLSEPAASTSPPPPVQPPPIRWWFWTLVFLLVITCAAIVTMIVWHQSRLALTRDRLDAARLRWLENRPERYQLEIQVAGATTGHYELIVDGKEVVAFKMNGQPADLAKGRFWTVDNFLEEILLREWEAMRQPQPTCFAQVEFDEHYGYPRNYIRTAQSRSTKTLIEMKPLPKNTLQPPTSAPRP